MEKYRSIDAGWDQNEYLYIDDCGELKEYYFNGKKHHAIIKQTDLFSINNFSIAERIVNATIADFDTGMYQFNGCLYFWIYNSVLGGHNKPESFLISNDYFEINFNKKIQKLRQISGIIENRHKLSRYNLKYCHSNEDWSFDLHSNGEIKVSFKPKSQFQQIQTFNKSNQNQPKKEGLPQWFLKCKKTYSDYVAIIEDTFAKIPLD